MEKTDFIEDNETIVPTRPVLGRRVTCQYYSPALVLSSNDEKRLQVALELLQTEEKYTCCLHTLKSVFEAKLKSSNILPLKDIESIFPNGLKEIRDTHDRLCSVLKERIHQWTYRSKVGDIFVQFFSDTNQFDLLGHYSSYSNNFPKAIRTISRCSRHSTEFEAFLQNCSSGPSWKGLDLHALLLNPIQRLPRYLLLLKQLMRFTDFNHPDRTHVEQALVAVSQTVTILNNSIESSLKVACEYTTRKRISRRRSLSLHQKESIKVLNKNSESVQTRDIKLRADENRNTTSGQSRPASICSSVSSGYASGEEGETPTLPPCPCNGPSCNAKHKELSRLVKELRHETALEQLARQKFDFSVSCISPTLQRLQELKRQQSAIPENGEKAQDKCPLSGESEMNTTDKDTKLESSELVQSDQKDLNDFKDDIDNIDQTMENFIEDFSTTISNIENLHLTNLLSAPPERAVLTRRSFSDGLPLSNQASCDSERDLGYHSPMDEAPLSSRSASNFQRFTKNRRSWAPQSSFSKQFAPCSDGFVVPPTTSQDVDDDNISIWSGLSTLSGESVMSGGSAMSVPVDGKHATKKRYFKLKDFFKTLRGAKEKRSPLFTHQTTMPTIEQEDTKPEVAITHPRMMISSV